MEKIRFNITPVEVYQIGTKKVYVKREDLCASESMPPLSKLRGIYKHLMQYPDGSLIGVCDTRVSKSGAGVAAICKELNIECFHFFPLKKGETLLNENRSLSQDNGATLFPLQAGAIRFVWQKAKKIVEQRGGTMLPHGLPFFETVQETAQVVMEEMDPKLLTGSIIMATGTATIFAGVVCGLLGAGILPKRLIGISSGMSKVKQNGNINRHVVQYWKTQFANKPSEWELSKNWHMLQQRIELKDPIMEYNAESQVVSPFPTHPNYDRKAWEWLIGAVEFLPEPILFWNIGS